MKSVLLALLLVASTSFAASVKAQVVSNISVGNKVTVAQRTVAPRVSSKIASSDATLPSRMMTVGVLNPWRNLFGGVLLGLGMGGLLSASAQHQALANQLSTLFLILLGMFLLVKLWHWWRNRTPRTYEWETYVPEIDARIESAGLQLPWPDQAEDNPVAQSVASRDANEHILGFEASVFINHAKTRFVCLQLAWDKGDFTSIRSITTPAMYAALRQQAQQPDRIARRTDVVQLFGTLLTVRVIDKEYVASVSFEGLMKPLPDASAEPFSEIWHISRPLAGKKGWALAGIQKIS